jgi:hypothetical protein
VNEVKMNPVFKTKAYKIFLEQKGPNEVAIALEIGNEETTKYWKEFPNLSKEYDLLKIRDELKKSFEPFVILYEDMKRENYTFEQYDQNELRIFKGL